MEPPFGSRVQANRSAMPPPFARWPDGGPDFGWKGQSLTGFGICRDGMTDKMAPARSPFKAAGADRGIGGFRRRLLRANPGSLPGATVAASFRIKQPM